MATAGVDFANPNAYQMFIYHSALIWYSLYIICTKQANLGLKAWLWNLLIILILVYFALCANSVLQSYNVNFFFLVKPPADNLPLLNLKNGWHAYFCAVLGLGVVLTGLVHLPFIIKEQYKKHKNEQKDNELSNLN